jgi:hypothetical protein
MPEVNLFNSSNSVAAMITVNRPGGVNYVHDAISSLTRTGFFDRFELLHLVAGCPNTDYIERYRDDPRIIIHDMSRNEKNNWKEMYLLSKCAYGHTRMIREIEAIPDWNEVLLLEDDIIFTNGWLSYLDAILPEIREKHRDNWMLALYQHYGVKIQHAKGLRWYPIVLPPEDPHYHGGLAEIHTRECLRGMADHIYATGVRQFVMPSDYATGDYIYSKGGEVLATAPSLVQHIGRVSTGQSGGFHQSDLFLEAV